MRQGLSGSQQAGEGQRGWKAHSGAFGSWAMGTHSRKQEKPSWVTGEEAARLNSSPSATGAEASILETMLSYSGFSKCALAAPVDEA